MIKRRSKPRRVSVARDPKYLEFLRYEGICPVIDLDRPWGHDIWFSIDPAHGRINGSSSKGSDLEAIPLCRFHHEEMERLRWPAFCEKYKLNRPEIVAYWNEQYAKARKI